jgi:hypothetical protein
MCLYYQWLVKVSDFTRTFKISQDDKGNYGFRIPPEDRKQYNAMLDKCMKARNGWATVKISMPRRYKSTGKNSQNSHFHVHCAQVAEELGYTAAYMKEWAKSTAVDLGYPQAQNDKGEKLFDRHGDPLGMTFGNASTEEASYCIEAIHRLAIDLNIKLREE